MAPWGSGGGPWVSGLPHGGHGMTNRMAGISNRALVVPQEVLGGGVTVVRGDP